MIVRNIKNILAILTLSLLFITPNHAQAQLTDINEQDILSEVGGGEIINIIRQEDISSDQILKALKGIESGEVVLEQVGTYIDEPHLDSQINTLMGNTPEQRYKVGEGVRNWIGSSDGQNLIKLLEGLALLDKVNIFDNGDDSDSEDVIEQYNDTADTTMLGTTETVMVQELGVQTVEQSQSSTSMSTYALYALPVVGLILGVLGGKYYLATQEDKEETNKQGKSDKTKQTK